MKLEPKYKELYQNWQKTKSTKDLQKLLDAAYPTIEKGLKVFGGGLPNLYGRAKLIALDAMASYDPNQAPLDSYLMLNFQRLQRFLPQTGSMIKIPEAIRMQARELENAAAELEAKLQRPPSDQEIADYMGISLKRIEKIRSAQGVVPGSAFGEEIVTQEEIPDAKLKLWIDTVYKESSPMQQYIMEHVYGLHGKKKKTLADIAKALKVSIGTVHGNLRKIEEKISLITKI